MTADDCSTMMVQFLSLLSNCQPGPSGANPPRPAPLAGDSGWRTDGRTRLHAALVFSRLRTSNVIRVHPPCTFLKMESIFARIVEAVHPQFVLPIGSSFIFLSAPESSESTSVSTQRRKDFCLATIEPEQLQWENKAAQFADLGRILSDTWNWSCLIDLLAA